jgi:glycosyltransferase involved in cell wall biosynthesis
MSRLSIVIPLCNEKESLAPLIESITGVLDPSGHEYEIVCVDDGSTDGSFGVLRELGKKHPDRLRALRFSRNYGKSAALSVGIESARGDVIITMDADLQDDPVAIPSMLAKLDEGYDLVSGWKKKRYDPLSFTMPSRFWNVITSMMSGVRLHDFNCGFKVYRAEVAKSLDIYGDRHRYLPALAHWDGFRVTEIPVPHHPRKFGKSKYGFSKFVNGVMDMLTLLFLKRYLKSPLHFFGLMGLFLMAIGGGVLGIFGVQWIIEGSLHVRPLMLLSMGAIIMGIQILSFGFLAEMITHSAPKNTYKIRESFE